MGGLKCRIHPQKTEPKPYGRPGAVTVPPRCAHLGELPRRRERGALRRREPRRGARRDECAQLRPPPAHGRVAAAQGAARAPRQRVPCRTQAPRRRPSARRCRHGYPKAPIATHDHHQEHLSPGGIAAPRRMQHAAAMDGGTKKVDDVVVYPVQCAMAAVRCACARPRAPPRRAAPRCETSVQRGPPRDLESTANFREAKVCMCLLCSAARPRTRSPAEPCTHPRAVLRSGGADSSLESIGSALGARSGP